MQVDILKDLPVHPNIVRQLGGKGGLFCSQCLNWGVPGE